MQYNNSKDTRELLSIFSSDLYSIEEEVLKDNLRKLVIYYDKHIRHQYHIISQFVNEKMIESEDAVSYILNNIDGMLAFLTYKREECNEIIADYSGLSVDEMILNLEKLYDHIALEEERIKNNSMVIRSSKEEIQNNVFETFNSIIVNFQNKVDEISNSLNANIITVVGLFSAIIFVFFGGVVSLSDAINSVCEIKNREDLTIPLISILFIGFILFNIIFLLLYSIAKIVDKNIGTIISGREYKWYCVEEIREGCYGVSVCGKLIQKCYKSQQEAEKAASRRRVLSEIKAGLKQTIKKAVFRFPYVLIINLILISGIIYLYNQI